MSKAPNSGVWSQEEAIALCCEIEAVCPDYGCHVALTGGALYKQGLRKDCDLLFYRIREVEKIDTDGLWVALDDIGLKFKSGFGWCLKAEYKGKPVDCFFPEDQAGGKYAESDPDDKITTEDLLR